MLRYSTIKECDKFKLSRVTNSKNSKSYYSVLLKDSSFGRQFTLDDYKSMLSVLSPLGKIYRLETGNEWRFNSRKTAEKKYIWALLLA